jgi:hypothetical protein
MTTQQPLFYTHFPYCIQHLGGDKYIILNRNYKPLGQTSFDYVDYEKHPSVIHMKITKKQATKLSYDGLIKSDYIYFYDNSDKVLRNPQTFNDYIVRLKLLATIIPKNVF